jgi:hypothetical protein
VCLHKHADVFLHNCAYTIWSLKGLEGFHLFVLVTFLCQKNSITLQKMQPSSILSWEIVVGLAMSQLQRFKTHLPSPKPTYYKQSIFDIDKYNQLTTCGLFLTWRDFDI